MTYEYKTIIDFPDYLINEFGNVISIKNGKRKELKSQMGNAGYLYIGLSKNNKAHNRFIHRLVAQTFIENASNKDQVNHIDGNKLNNHISNLEWISAKDNIKHAFINGLIKRSEKQNQNLGLRSRKKVIDVISNKQYDSLKIACEINNINYISEINKIKRKSKTIRFIYS